MTIDVLASKQNPDGGWPYVRGASWTEPTVYSLLAMLSQGEKAGADRALQWILRTQRSDGGFSAKAGIDESSWVTALVALLPPEHLGAAAHERAIRWLLSTTGKESTPIYRLREWMLGHSRPAEQEFPAGWPWIPGTAAWVGPTSLAILALEKEGRRRPSAQIDQRVAEGRHFLMTRMCQEGGWNHGSSRALGYESRPYPETTGMALAALRGTHTAAVQRAIDKALQFLGESRSCDALNWLYLGLSAHDQMPRDYSRPADVECRTLLELSFDSLVAAVRKGSSLPWG